MDVNSTLIISAGVLDVTSANYTIDVGGGWTSTSGTFAERSGTVTFNSAIADRVVTAGTQSFNDVIFDDATAAVTRRGCLRAIWKYREAYR